MTYDLSDVRSVRQARMLEVAAAGDHWLAVVTPSSVGAAFLARRLVGLLPRLPEPDAAERARLLAAAGFPEDHAGRLDPAAPPLRAPHHTVSAAGLFGRSWPAPRVADPERRAVVPGEVSLADGGVLLLDDAPELSRGCVEGLLHSLHSGVSRIVGGGVVTDLPARPTVVLGVPSCPCGRLGAGPGVPACACSPASRERYHGRVKALVGLCGLVYGGGAVELAPRGPTTAEVSARVVVARDRQARRWGPGARLPHAPTRATDGAVARRLGSDYRAMERAAGLDADASAVLAERVPDAAARTLVAGVARTIADLDMCGAVLRRHAVEALDLRDDALARPGVA